jgi:hypothetical protein
MIHRHRARRRYAPIRSRCGSDRVGQYRCRVVLRYVPSHTGVGLGGRIKREKQASRMPNQQPFFMLCEDFYRLIKCCLQNFRFIEELV